MSLPLPIAALAAASHVAPTLVAPIFRRMMLKPRRHVRPPPVLALPAADERIALGDDLVAWRWGQGPAVLLVHGFEGNRAQFGAIIAALVERGFSAVALDVPAHGESAGDELTAVKFIAAIERVLAHLGPVRAVIGHSMGGAMSLYSVAHAGGAHRVALISAPSSLKRELLRLIAGEFGVDNVKTLHGLVVGDNGPDLTIILDMPAEEGLRRATSNGGETRFEEKGVAFQARVREAFLQIARENPARCVVVDASGTIEEVGANVSAAVKIKLPGLLPT